MKRRPAIADLFSGAGGAARGLIDAGAHVVGFDIKPQPRYPGPSLVADAMALLESRDLDVFDAIWASPPCQGYTNLRHAKGARGAPRLVAQVRSRLQAWSARTGKPWILENVDTSEVLEEMGGEALRLCGSMFGLGVECDPHGRRLELQRHRLFCASFELKEPGPCRHSGAPVLGVYGGHARIRAAAHGGRTTRDNWGPAGHRPIAAEAMGMPWATLAEMSEAIPPAYTRHLGAQLIAAIQQGRAA